MEQPLSLDEYCNEPAFPENVSVTGFTYRDGSPEELVRRSENKGLTRLEYFTAQAMSKPDPVASAKAIIMELWQTRNKGFAGAKNFVG